MKKAPCRIGGRKMGRRLLKVHKVITCLLISDIAFPWILSGISRLHIAVRRWSWELTSCVLSGWKLSSEPSPQAGPSPKHAGYPSPSWAALLENSTNTTCYCWQAPSHVLQNLAGTTRVGGGLFLFFVFFCYSDADSFTQPVRKLTYPSRRI